ncbi:hypothetical protein M885DRAFT_543612 [Pelagophyceae sp. CCMP2097]|nr:hypothetical protein M885DRAFT_543612 [Pelagophyceae sp. CCMP2097]
MTAFKASPESEWTAICAYPFSLGSLRGDAVEAFLKQPQFNFVVFDFAGVVLYEPAASAQLLTVPLKRVSAQECMVPAHSLVELAVYSSFDVSSADKLRLLVSGGTRDREVAVAFNGETHTWAASRDETLGAIASRTALRRKAPRTIFVELNGVCTEAGVFLGAYDEAPHILLRVSRGAKTDVDSPRASLAAVPVTPQLRASKAPAAEFEEDIIAALLAADVSDSDDDHDHNDDVPNFSHETVEGPIFEARGEPPVPEAARPVIIMETPKRGRGRPRKERTHKRGRPRKHPLPVPVARERAAENAVENAGARNSAGKDSEPSSDSADAKRPKLSEPNFPAVPAARPRWQPHQRFDAQGPSGSFRPVACC